MADGLTCSDLPFQTPLIIYLFHFVVDYAEMTFMVGDLRVHVLDERVSVVHLKVSLVSAASGRANCCGALHGSEGVQQASGEFRVPEVR